MVPVRAPRQSPVNAAHRVIIPIGRWVLKTASAQNMAWQSEGLPAISMAVNLSPRQFLDANLLDDIDEVLASTGMPAHLLQLEITESMVMHYWTRFEAAECGWRSMTLARAIHRCL